MTPGTSGSSCGSIQAFADQRPVFDKKGKRRKKTRKMPAPAKQKGGIKWY